MDTTEVAILKPKRCWVPFQKVYCNRKQFQGADYAPPPSVYYLKGMGADGQPANTEVALYEYEGDTASHALGTTELVLQGHPIPGMLGPEDLYYGREIIVPNSHCNINSLKLDALPRALAEIEPNCMKKDFWVDEIVAGGSLACLDEMPGSSTFRARFGRRQSSQPVEDIYKEDVEAQMIEDNADIDSINAGGQSPPRMERRPSRSRSRPTPRRLSRSTSVSSRRSRSTGPSMQSESWLVESISDRLTIEKFKKSRSEASQAAMINRQALSEFNYVSNPDHFMQKKSQAEDVEPQGDGLTPGPSSKEKKGFSLFGRTRSKKQGKEKKPKVVIDIGNSAELHAEDIRRTASLVDDDSAFQESNAEGFSITGADQDLFNAGVIDKKMEKMFEAERQPSWYRGKAKVASNKPKPEFAFEEEKKDDGSGIFGIQSRKSREPEPISFAHIAMPYSQSSDTVGSKKTLSSRQLMAEKVKKRVRSNASARSDASPDGSNKSNTQEQGKRDVKEENYVPEEEVSDPEQVLNWLQNKSNSGSSLWQAQSNVDASQESLSFGLRDQSSIETESRVDAVSIKHVSPSGLVSSTKTNLPRARSSGDLRRKQSENLFPFAPALNPFNDVSSAVFDTQLQTEVDPDIPFAVFESATNPILSVPSFIPHEPSGFSRSNFSDVGMIDVADMITARRKEKTKSSGRSVIQAPRRKDEEDSFGDDADLNTEAFRKYEDSDEEDSIFSDLQTVEESVKGKEDSSFAVSRDVTESKEYSRARRVKHSRHDNSSKFSRGDITTLTDAYSSAGHDGAFACMDKWLD
jgi:hypothetical protein